MAERILVIEDNPASLNLVTYLIRAFGHEPISAVNGLEGLEAARTQSPDVILCDVQLPKLSGYEICRELKNDASLQNIPLVAFTALAMVGDREKLLECGFDGYISKPIYAETFLGQLQPYLKRTTLFQRNEDRALDENGVENGEALRNGETVVVVDNNSANRRLLTDLLNSKGYNAVGASSVECALELARDNVPYGIVSDVHMPDIDGFEFLSIVKQDARLKDIPFIFMSASYWGESDSMLAADLGADLYLSLPAEPNELLRTIDICLRRIKSTNA